MKRFFACIAAIAPLALATAQAGEGFQHLAGDVKVDAFAKADKSWKRIMTMRNFDCGEVGKSGVTRVDLLVSAYDQLAKAVSANDAAGAESAGSAFAKTARQNMRFASCWATISSSVNVSRSLPGRFEIHATPSDALNAK